MLKRHGGFVYFLRSLKFWKSRKLLAVWMLFAVAFTPGCKEKHAPRFVERSFYHWKATLSIDQPLRKLLTGLEIKRLYVRFFDVAWNSQLKEPMPMAILKVQETGTVLNEVSVIPAVFITTECIEKMDAGQAEATANKIFQLIRKIAAGKGWQIPEVQMDCDWNASTKDKYFSLLRNLKQLTTAANLRLSATIRLYQCKYRSKAGVPPVDRGLLMCYNMGDLKSLSTNNSILDAAELKKYAASLPEYPLKLDLALPLFGWKVLFREGRYRGLISNLSTTSLTANSGIMAAGNKYMISHDTTLEGYELKAGDILRDEQVLYDDVANAAGYLSSKLHTDSVALSLYHLDSLTLSKYSLHELETIFDRLH